MAVTIPGWVLRRFGVMLVSLAAVLVATGACTSRPVMVPMCEGVLYTWQANRYSEAAIDALEVRDMDERDQELAKARFSMREAAARLDEATKVKTEGWDPILTAFDDAMGVANAAIAAIATSSSTDAQRLREAVLAADAALGRVGPPSSCIPKVSPSP